MSGFAPLALCDRAFSFLVQHGPTAEDALLAYVYGGTPPTALRNSLAAPLSNDGRLERRADGTWTLKNTALQRDAFTALALATSGPSPSRARILRVAALHVHAGQVVASFDVLLNPQVRVPKYVLRRIGIETDVLEEQNSFASIYEDFVEFLADRPVLAQEAHLAWAFVATEARRIEQIVPDLPLIDVNSLAGQLVPGKKPTLVSIAAQLGISVVNPGHPDEEARVLALVGAQLLGSVCTSAQEVPRPGVLGRAATATALPDEPGVYVMRDADKTPVYVGKAKRLRSRVRAYVHRPLGATRRLEGLVGTVDAVDTSQCETDVEALVLEDREIRRLQPRFNTVRQQREPRYWIVLPPQHYSRAGKPLAPPRLELSLGSASDEGDFVGPFRNETTAEQVRQLARDVFELDELRRADPFAYAQRLRQALDFLRGDTTRAELLARRSVQLLRKVAGFDVGKLLLPADPRHASYAIVRPTHDGRIEGFRLDRAVVAAWTVLAEDDGTEFARSLLEYVQPRTAPEDVTVVLRWFGAQRPPAHVIHLGEDSLAAADAIEDAAYALLEARATGGQDPLDPFV